MNKVYNDLQETADKAKHKYSLQAFSLLFILCSK